MTPFRLKAHRISRGVSQAHLLRWALVLIAMCTLRMSTFAQTATSGDQPGSQATPVRAADASCAGCHAAITKNYLATPMANASGLAIDRFKSGDFLHQPSGVTYSFSLQNNQPTYSYIDKSSSQTSPPRKLQYFLGSGHLGLTYLYTINNYLFETPLAYYASHGLDMKPGLESLTTAAPALPVQAECLRCHMSAVRESDQGTINRYNGLPFAHAGITCESCHGDTTSHVATSGKSPVINPSKLDAEARDSICISCHLEGDVSVDHAGRSMFDFKPGNSIGQYRTYFVYQKQDAAARGVSEVEQFNQSMCKRSSGPAMSCVNCHDPHFSPAPEQRVLFYRAKCLTCHTGQVFQKDHHPDNPDCTSCHMPRTGAQNTPHVAWTDHRILKLPATAAATTDIASSDTLLPVLSPSATERDLAMAYYKGLLAGNAALETKAYGQLSALQKQLASDRDALDALGVLSAQHGELAQATDDFKQVLALDKNNLIASSNLGTLMAKAGNLRGAIDLWDTVSERNQDIVGLSKNVARLKCMTGDIAGARSTLLRALQYSPSSADMQHMLEDLPACEARKPSLTLQQLR
jgi:predicted CXXCH cytochrome family protein